MKIFNDKEVVTKVQSKLPKLFQIAEIENMKGGKIGMQVSTTRENIITALLIDTFGESNVNSDIPITEAEVDVKVYNIPYSIKTLSSKDLTGLKLVWSGDNEQAISFSDEYYPSCGMIFTHIQWDTIGGFYYFPLKCQEQVLEAIGRKNYIKALRKGTNNRGVELNSSALRELLKNPVTSKIEISWKRQKVDYKPYTRCVDLRQQ